MVPSSEIIKPSEYLYNLIQKLKKISRQMSSQSKSNHTTFTDSLLSYLSHTKKKKLAVVENVSKHMIEIT